MKLFTRIVFLSLVFAGQSALADEAQDVAALHALDQAYASEWMRGSPESVLSLFVDDATLVPHHGDAPVVGKEAIRRFWFNPDYPPTVVVEWQRETKEVVVSGDMAIVRGRSLLSWEYQGVRTTISEGNYVMVAVRRAADWRIRMLTWNDDPRTWIQENVQ